MGLADSSARLHEDAHRRLLAEGRPREAAMAAMGVAATHFLRGENAAGSGWLGRATRLLADLPEGVEHGLILYFTQVEGALDGPDPQMVIDAAHRVQRIGKEHGDAGLTAMGILGEGRALVRQGHVARGMALLDEAMVAAVSDEISPDWTGNIFCHLIAACYELADLRRAWQWVSLTQKWLDSMPAAVVFSGICRVHQAQLLGLRGEWEASEQKARLVCEELADVHLATAAEAHYTIGELCRWRGDLTAAEEAYQRAHRLGRDPQPGLSLLRLDQGRGDAAAASIRAALMAETANRLTRARLCSAQVEIALAVGDAATARKASDELKETADLFGSEGLRATAAHAGGAVLLAEGHAAEALGLLRAACRQWRELQVPYQTAQTRLLLAKAYKALGDDDAAAREVTEAQAALDQLRPAGKTALLTDREIEVLGLAAAGRTNKQIAVTLGIAEKTVARHLSNIFTKIGVESRTEAAAYAFSHRLATPARG